jgi:hypothetical protein
MSYFPKDDGLGTIIVLFAGMFFSAGWATKAIIEVSKPVIKPIIKSFILKYFL